VAVEVVADLTIAPFERLELDLLLVVFLLVLALIR